MYHYLAQKMPYLFVILLFANLWVFLSLVDDNINNVEGLKKFWTILRMSPRSRENNNEISHHNVPAKKAQQVAMEPLLCARLWWKRSARLDVPCGNKLESFFTKVARKGMSSGAERKNDRGTFFVHTFLWITHNFWLANETKWKERRKTFSPVIVWRNEIFTPTRS